MTEGRIHDVLVEDWITGLRVWADEGLQQIIASVPGVRWCGGDGTEYTVHLDPRYDKDWIREEIVARVKIGAQNV